MRRALLLSLVVIGCSAKTTSGFDDPGGSPTDGDAGTTSSSSGGSSSGAPPALGGDAGTPSPPDGSVVVTTTIYANTDDSLYSMDPQTQAVTLIGKFTGTGGGTNDGTVTDVAVNAAGDVYVNTESVVYRATLPSGAGAVQLAKIATISLKQGQRFYALAFAPAGALGSDEVLIGGDGTGEVWSIDTSSGATKHLGNFGKDPRDATKVLALSGDLVFYLDASSKPTGLATIRSCASGGASCDHTSDFLAGVDMTALATAYTSGTPAASLLGGIYGGSGGSIGSGVGRGDLFGLGAWQGNVYSFARSASGTPAQLLTVDTTSGKGSALPATFSFTNGWSGAGVTTKVTINVPPPPPPPK
jgi:hypothetical protein